MIFSTLLSFSKSFKFSQKNRFRAKKLFFSKFWWNSQFWLFFFNSITHTNFSKQNLIDQKNSKKFILKQLAKIKTCRLLRKNFSYINGAIKINSFKQPISMTLVTILISNAESHSDWCYCSHSVCMFGFSVCFALFPSLCAPRLMVCVLYTTCVRMEYTVLFRFFSPRALTRSFIRLIQRVTVFYMWEWESIWVCGEMSVRPSFEFVVWLFQTVHFIRLYSLK